MRHLRAFSIYGYVTVDRFRRHGRYQNIRVTNLRRTELRNLKSQFYHL